MELKIIASTKTGRLLRVLRDGVDQMPREPEEPSIELVIDDTTNAELVDHLCAHAYDYRLTGGTLYRNSKAVTVSAPGEVYTERQAALTLVQGLKQYNSLASPTNAQSVAAIKANNRLTLILGRLLLRELASE